MVRLEGHAPGFVVAEQGSWAAGAVTASAADHFVFSSLKSISAQNV